MDYLYTVNSTSDFVIQDPDHERRMGDVLGTQDHEDGSLKREACTGIIDYCKIFRRECAIPRPYYQRNPYHLGYYMWNHIEELYEQGRVSLDFVEETDVAKKETWDRPGGKKPLEAMEHIIRTCTDYEFLRRFLTVDLVEKFHLNRIPKSHIPQLGLSAHDVAKEDKYHIWIDPDPVKEQMLQFFTHFHRPRIYLIDVDFLEGGLLLYHRNDGRDLRRNWIKPTLKNINLVWKGPVSLLCKETLYTYSSGKFKTRDVEYPEFDVIMERMRSGKRPFFL